MRKGHFPCDPVHWPWRNVADHEFIGPDTEAAAKSSPPRFVPLKSAHDSRYFARLQASGGPAGQKGQNRPRESQIRPSHETMWPGCEIGEVIQTVATLRSGVRIPRDRSRLQKQA